MSKPIFIMRFPYNTNADRETMEYFYSKISEQLHDYHVLSLVDNSVEKLEFECYNSPHTEIEFEDLKRKVMDIVNSPLPS